MTTYESRLSGLETSLAIKAPVLVATTASITLSGLQTIDGVSLSGGERVLVKDQSDANDNGIYLAATGAWARASDFNGARDVTRGTSVFVASGTIAAGREYFITTSSPAIGSTDIDFSMSSAFAAAEFAESFYDGPAVDEFSNLAAVASEVVAVGGFIRVIGANAIYERAPDAATDAALDYSGGDGVKWYLRGSFVGDDQVDDVADIADAAYAAGAAMLVRPSTQTFLACNPTSDDIQDMAAWAMSQKMHAGGDAFYLQISDGLHDVRTYLDIYSSLDIRGTAAPDFIQISGATFGSPTGNVYPVTVTVGSALPARVVVGYSLGMQNVKGDGGAEALNGALIVSSIAGDRLSFTAQTSVYGIAPTDFTTPDNTLTLGLTANQVVVPQACIRANSAGWDGAAREGFINVFGGKTSLRYLGFTFNGVTGEHDMMFAKHGRLVLEDRVTIAGAGDKVLRTSYSGSIHANRATLGGAGIATQIYQGVGNDRFDFIRGCFGSASAEIISATANTRVFGTSSILTGGARGLRSTYSGSNITIAGGSRISHCTTGIQIDLGDVQVSASEVLMNCTNPAVINGAGYIFGSPSLSGNTNPMPAENYPVNGGGWYADTTKPISKSLVRISTSVDFPSIAANSFGDVGPISYPGVVFGMKIDVTATSTLPSQGFDVKAFVSAADEITFRAFNVTTSAINPATKTYYAQATATA